MLSEDASRYVKEPGNLRGLKAAEPGLLARLVGSQPSSLLAEEGVGENRGRTGHLTLRLLPCCPRSRGPKTTVSPKLRVGKKARIFSAGFVTLGQ